MALRVLPRVWKCAHTCPCRMWRVPQKVVKTLVLMLLLAARCFGEPKPFEHGVDWSKIALLSAAEFGADFWDMRQTRLHYLEDRRNNLPYIEHNPFTKVLLPHPGLLYARPVATAALTAFLSYKLSTNRRAWVRRLRYAPECVQISANAQGMIYSRLNWKRR
jgi:hypothetical protein